MSKTFENWGLFDWDIVTHWRHWLTATTIWGFPKIRSDMISLLVSYKKKCIASWLSELLPACNVHMITPDIDEVPSRNRLTGAGVSKWRQIGQIQGRRYRQRWIQHSAGILQHIMWLSAMVQDYKLVAGWEKKRRAEVPVCPVFGLLRYHVRY